MKKEKLVLVQVLVTEPLDRWIRQSAKKAKTPVSRWIRQLLQAKRMELPRASNAMEQLTGAIGDVAKKAIETAARLDERRTSKGAKR